MKKTKKLLTVFLTLALVGAAGALAACGHTHEYTAAVTEPTCTEEGYTTYTCECGDSYVDGNTAALGHEFTEYVSDGNATYDSDGTKTAHCNRTGCEATDTVIEENTKLDSRIVFKTLTCEGQTVGAVFSNATTEFSFKDEIEVCGNVTFEVSKDEYGSQSYLTKKVPLAEGDNVFYVFEIEGEDMTMYTVTLRRRPMYTVAFNTNGGEAVESQTVEEGCLASEPTTTRVGYTFAAWEYDFTAPITGNTTIEAKWTANEDTAYKVEYYLQNVDGNGFTLAEEETENLTGTTDTTASAEIKEFAHFTAMKESVTGNISGDGSAVLKVYYTRNRYEVKTSGNNDLAGGYTSVNRNCYYETEITVTATTNLGYTFVGWYAGEMLVSNEAEFSFTTQADIEYIAKWTVNEEMQPFTFTSTATTCSITGLNDKTATEIVIPDSVTSIGDWAFYNCSSLTSVVIGDSVTSIGDWAFYNCSSLTSIDIPDGVTSIGNWAFEDCSSLTSVVIGDSVTSIGSSAFRGCYKLVEVVNKSPSITVTKGGEDNGYIGYYALAVYNSGDTFESKLSNDNGYIVYTDEDEKILVGYTGQETDLTLLSYITQINQYAFYGCGSLTSVKIPEGVTSIGKSAFEGCSSLTSIDIPNSVTSIGDDAFYYCSNLTSIDIPDSVTSIGFFTFYDCSSLTSVVIPDSVTSIGGSAFYYCSSLTSVVIGDSVTSIGNSAFYYCSSLTSIDIPDSVTSIGEYAFRGCDSLTGVYITDIAAWCNISFSYDWANPLYYAKNLYLDNNLVTELVIPEDVTEIKAYAFSYYRSLTSVKIPDSVTSIGGSAFAECRSLTSVVIPDSVTSIGDYAFRYCSSLTIYCKAESQPKSWRPNWNSSNRPVYWYSESKPTEDGNFWRYVNGVPTVW